MSRNDNIKYLMISDQLYANGSLNQNDKLFSQNKRYYLTVGYNGIIEIYDNMRHTQTWSNQANTFIKKFIPPCKLILSANSIYLQDINSIQIWEQKLVNAYRLIISNQGYIIIYNHQNQQIWTNHAIIPEEKIDLTSNSFIDAMEKYHKCSQFLLIFLIFLFGIGVSLLSSLQIYMLSAPNLVCANNATNTFIPCTKEEACNAYKYKEDSSSYVNWLIEYKLLCNGDAMNYFLIILSYIGALLGCFFLMPLSDKYGRKQVLTLSVISTCLVCLKVITSTDFLTLIICITIIGILTSVYYNIAIMMAVERSSSKLRVIYVSIIMSSAPIGRYLEIILMSKLQHWKTIALISTIFTFLLIMLIGFFQESPRYLISRYNYLEASYSASKILKESKAICFPQTKITKWMQRREEEPYPFSELFSYPSAQSTTVIMAILFFSFGIMNKGMIIISEKKLVYLPSAQLIANALDFLSCAATLFIILLANKQESIIKCTILITSAISIIAPIFSNKNMLLMICANRFISQITLITGTLYAMESYPTRIRGIGIGVCTASANISKILAILILIKDNSLVYALGIISTSCLLIWWCLLPPLIPTELTDEIIEVCKKQ